MMTKIIFTTLIVSIMTSVQVFSQQMSEPLYNTEEMQTGMTINEDDFTCFQDLQCLKLKNPFNNSNLNEFNYNSNSYESYVINGSSRDEEVYAVYDKKGRLIKATLTQRNFRLPKAIEEALRDSEFADWKVVGSELTVENFDKRKMQYKVVLQNEGIVRVTQFDRDGNIQNHFS